MGGMGFQAHDVGKFEWAGGFECGVLPGARRRRQAARHRLAARLFQLPYLTTSNTMMITMSTSASVDITIV